MVDKKGLRHREKWLLWGGVSFFSTFDVVFCFRCKVTNKNIVHKIKSQQIGICVWKISISFCFSVSKVSYFQYSLRYVRNNERCKRKKRRF